MAKIMTTKEVAEYLKLSDMTVWKLSAAGKIPAFRIGRTWRFEKEAIDKWLRKGQTKH